MGLDVAAMPTRPADNLVALPDLTHRQVGLGLGEVVGGNELLDALTGDAEEFSDLSGAHEVMHEQDHSHEATRHLTRGQGRADTSHMTRTPASSSYKPRYTVRKQSSGYAFSETYYVYDLVGKGRVSVHAGTKESAQIDADNLNVTELTALAADDPRPYDERRAEAKAKYEAITGRKVY